MVFSNGVLLWQTWPCHFWEGCDIFCDAGLENAIDNSELNELFCGNLKDDAEKRCREWKPGLLYVLEGSFWESCRLYPGHSSNILSYKYTMFAQLGLKYQLWLTRDQHHYNKTFASLGQLSCWLWQSDNYD